jgi:HEAT repeat protein
MAESASAILWLGVLFALCAIGAVIVLAMARQIITFRQVVQGRKRDAIIERLLQTALGDASQGLQVRWTDNPLLLAKVLGRALELVSGDDCRKLVDVAARFRCEAGLLEMASSRQTHMRMTALRCLRYFPSSAALTRRLAQRDPSHSVRAEAILALAYLDMAPPARVWSSWMVTQNARPHPSLKSLLKTPALASTSSLEALAKQANAPIDARCWAIETLVARDVVNTEKFVLDVALDPLQEVQLRIAALGKICDPLSITRHFVSLASADDWRMVKAACVAAGRLHATTLGANLAQLTSHADWRVRSAANTALFTLGLEPTISAAAGSFVSRHNFTLNLANVS